jgi:hypothetical protein
MSRASPIEKAMYLSAAMVLTVTAALLRWPFFLAGLWRDEAETFFDVSRRGIGAMLAEISLSENNPPGYFFLERFWLAVAGNSEFALKAPSFVCGIALVPVTYALARQSGSRAAGLIAASFATFSLMGVELAGDARPYTLAALLSACVTLLAIATVRRGNIVYAGCFAIAATALAYVQYTGLLVVASLAVVAFFQACASRRGGPLLVPAAAAVAGAAYVPQWPTFVYTERVSLPWLPHIQPDALFGAFLAQIAYALPLDVARTTVALECLIPLAVAGVVFRDRLARSEYLYLVAPVVIGAALETKASLLNARYMYAFAPLAQAALAIALVALVRTVAGTARTRRWTPSTVACAAMAVVAVVSVIGMAPREFAIVRFAYTHSEISGMRALVRSERDVLSPRTLVVVAPDYLGPTFGYYSLGRGVTVVGFPHRDAPQFFRWDNYADAWLAPGVVEKAEANVEQRFDSRYDRLALLVDSDLTDRGRLRYTLANELAAALTRRFRVITHRSFDGREEAVSITILERRNRFSRRPVLTGRDAVSNVRAGIGPATVDLHAAEDGDDPRLPVAHFRREFGPDVALKVRARKIVGVDRIGGVGTEERRGLPV